MHFLKFLWLLDNVFTLRWIRDVTITIALISIPNSIGGIGVGIGSTLGPELGVVSYH